MVPLFLKASRKQLLVIASGLILLLVGVYNYYSIRTLSFSQSPQQSRKTIGEMPVQITIPSLKIDIPLEVADIKDGVWEISYKSATFLNSSARPGTGGNTVVYGHNKKAIFGSIPFAKVGEKVFIKTQDNTIHTYEIISKETVGPDRVDLVFPTNQEELTIFTCTGIFDSQRVILKAKPI